MKEWFATPYTASLEEVIARFDNQASYYAKDGYQAIIELGKDRKVTLTWKTS
jgi:hypothetical protein